MTRSVVTHPKLIAGKWTLGSVRESSCCFDGPDAVRNEDRRGAAVGRLSRGSGNMRERPYYQPP
ncbi:hypothetical protein MTO96_052150, partial [Rhipicephalus appendiculatus]